MALCTPGAALASPGDYLESFGPDGTAATEFEAPAAVAVDPETGSVYVGDSGSQILYKFDADGNPLNYGGSEPYISENKISGLAMNSKEGLAQVAVDPATHVVYVTSANKVRAFEADGEPHIFTAGPGAGTSEIPGATELSGVAIDSSGNIYASDLATEKVRIYSAAGAFVTEFKAELNNSQPGRPFNLAVAADGTLYSPQDFGNAAVNAYEPSEFPVTAETTYGTGREVNHELSLSVTVDPATQYVYIGGNEGGVSVYDEDGGFIGFIGDEGPGKFEADPVGLGVFGKRLYGVTHFGTKQVSVFETLTPPVLEPSITSTAATDVSNTTTTLRGKINPNTLATTYHFEYGTANCSVEPSACTSAPIGGASIGSGFRPVSVSVDLSGLAPDTVYYYRIVATNSLDTTQGPVRTFRTQSSAFGFVAMDGRVWEQVTPIDKHGGAVIISPSVLKQAAADGSSFAFMTRESVVETPEGNRAVEPAAALARRTGAGSWGVTDLVPPQPEATGASTGTEYKAFSPDLARGLLEPRDAAPLSDEASDELTPYLRLNISPPVYRPLVTSKEGFANVPAGTVFGGEPTSAKHSVSVEGANEALTAIVVRSKVPLTVGAGPNAIYLWHDGTLEPVSEMPGGGNEVIPGHLGASISNGTISVRNAVSSDGLRVFWTGEYPNRALFLRDTAKHESFRLDVPQAGSTEAGEVNPVFLAASADGSVVFFTDSQQLTADASPEGRNLYRCRIGDVGGSLGCADLENLSPSLGAEKVTVEELALGMSDDGNTLYFVERKDSKTPDLYVWQEGHGVHFIASLSFQDHLDWGSQNASSEKVENLTPHGAFQVASSSPSGRFLAFMSERSLAGTETADPESGHPVQHVYVYDELTENLACASCNASGSTDRGYPGGDHGRWEPPDIKLPLVGGQLPELSEIELNGPTLYYPRAVLDNGRVFFDSPLPLVPSDSNGLWDVYQYEPFGVGSCNAGARQPSIAVAEGACVGLISAGTGDRPSTFLDASASGDDVFFGTTDRLSVLDSDSILDVYDARVGGVAAVAETRPECLGEACQPPPSPPNDATPASAAFEGSGNPKPKGAKHCRRGQRKVRHRGKVTCVKRQRHHKHKPSRGGHR